MASEIGRVGDGAIPVPINNSDETQEVKSPPLEKQPVGATENSTINELPARASEKEASAFKNELSIESIVKRAIVEGQLNRSSGQQQARNVINGTSGDDRIHVSKAEGLLGQLGLIEVDVNGTKQYFTPEQLKHLQIKAGAGDDVIVIDPNVKQGIHVDGEGGNDVIFGGGGDDVLVGGSGDDMILGRGGHDYIVGGRGKDYIDGGAGKDIIIGGKGEDMIKEGTGDDFVDAGHDSIDGGKRKDKIKL